MDNHVKNYKYRIRIKKKEKQSVLLRQLESGYILEVRIQTRSESVMFVLLYLKYQIQIYYTTTYKSKHILMIMQTTLINFIFCTSISFDAEVANVIQILINLVEARFFSGGRGVLLERV